MFTLSPYSLFHSSVWVDLACQRWPSVLLTSFFRISSCFDIFQHSGSTALSTLLPPPPPPSCEWRFCLWPWHPLPLRSNLCSSLCPADWQIATLVLLVAGAVATLAAFMAALVSLCQGTQRQHYRTVAVFLFTAGELASNSATSCQSPIVKWSINIRHVILNTVISFTNLADFLLATSAM